MIATMLKNFPMLDYVWFFQEDTRPGQTVTFATSTKRIQ
jgi:hypothetical protein